MSAFSLGFKATAAAIEAVRQVRNGARAALESTGHATCVAVDSTKSASSATAGAVTGFFNGVKVAVENRGRLPAQADLFAEPVTSPAAIEDRPLCQEVVVGRKAGSVRIPRMRLYNESQRLNSYLTALVLTDCTGKALRVDVQACGSAFQYRLITDQKVGQWRTAERPLLVEWASVRKDAGWKAVEIEISELPL